MEQQVGIAARIIGGVVGFFGIAGTIFGFGKYNAKLVKKNELYDEHGNQRYLSVGQSHKNIADCRDTMAREMAGVKDKLDKISDFLVKINDERIKTSNLMGRIEQYMDSHK